MWVRVMPRERLSFASRRPYEPYRTFHTYLHHYADKNLEAISAMLAKYFERIHRSNLVDIGYFVNKKRHVMWRVSFYFSTFRVTNRDVTNRD